MIVLTEKLVSYYVQILVYYYEFISSNLEYFVVAAWLLHLDFMFTAY